MAVLERGKIKSQKGLTGHGERWYIRPMQKILIDDQVHREAKAAAAMMGVSLRWYVENALSAMANSDLANPNEARATIGKLPKRETVKA